MLTSSPESCPSPATSLLRSALVEPPVVQLPCPGLYRAQSEGVTRFTEQKSPRRLVLAWGTGVGKTAAALTCMELLQPARVLIICPALVRRHWLAEVKKWAPSYDSHAHVIELGRERSVSGSAGTIRARAFRARVQIVSYDLLRDVDDSPWDLIIVDETHHLANPKIKVSKRFEELLAANRKVDVLALSATLIPTEAEQLWNPMRLLFPRDGWGKPWNDGGVCWRFKWRYCEVEKTEYGHQAYGCKESMRSELRRRLLKVCHPLTREDISADLPPLDLRTITLSEVNKGRKTKIQKVTFRCLEWAEGIAQATDKIIILVHHREVARNIYDHIRATALDLKDHHLYYIDGSVPTKARDVTLHNAAMAPKAILIGTHDSLLEGIRLMWADQVLIDEWGQSPGKMVQLMGRFNSVGSSRRPAVNLVTDADTYGAAQTLIYRLTVVNELLGGGATIDQLKETLKEENMSDEDVKNEWLDMFAGANLNSERDDWVDDER